MQNVTVTRYAKGDAGIDDDGENHWLGYIDLGDSWTIFVKRDNTPVMLMRENLPVTVIPAKA